MVPGKVELGTVPAASTMQWTLHLFSHSVMSESLWSHGLQSARLPCPSPSPGVYSNSCALSHWYHATFSFSHPLLLLPSIVPASGSFPLIQLFASGGQSIGALPSVLPAIIQGWFPLGLTGLISSLSKGLSRVAPAPWFESINYFTLSLLMVQLSHPYIIHTWLLEKPWLWLYGPLQAK